MPLWPRLELGEKQLENPDLEDTIAGSEAGDKLGWREGKGWRKTDNAEKGRGREHRREEVGAERKQEIKIQGVWVWWPVTPAPGW